jgi:hypothetical protein
MAAESFFNRIADQVIRVTEQIQTRMEEGLGVMWNGELPPKEEVTGNGGARATSGMNGATLRRGQ